jgi:hypothetical protein
MDTSEHVDLMGALAGSTAGTNTSLNKISGRAWRLAGRSGLPGRATTVR